MSDPTPDQVYPGDVKQGTHRIVVVGGGAGGLELVTRLGDRLGKRGRAHVTLIEKARTHFWKPHLHEIAAGSADVHDHATNYLAQARWHGFRYRVGEMVGLDREKRLVHVAPSLDEDGQPITPPYTRAYDTLGCIPPTYEPRATGHIPEMIALVERLVENGVAYVADDGSVYFAIDKFADYDSPWGQLELEP
jgi:cysteinyl-tRNA synthetase